MSTELKIGERFHSMTRQLFFGHEACGEIRTGLMTTTLTTTTTMTLTTMMTRVNISGSVLTFFLFKAALVSAEVVTKFLYVI